MDFLKTQNISYSVTKKDYAGYFRRFADANQMYVASEEERAADAAAARTAGFVAVAVLLGPIALFAVFAGMYN